MVWWEGDRSGLGEIWWLLARAAKYFIKKIGTSSKQEANHKKLVVFLKSFVWWGGEVNTFDSKVLFGDFIGVMYHPREASESLYLDSLPHGQGARYTYEAVPMAYCDGTVMVGR